MNEYEIYKDIDELSAKYNNAKVLGQRGSIDDYNGLISIPKTYQFYKYERIEDPEQIILGQDVSVYRNSTCTKYAIVLNRKHKKEYNDNF
jgi:hypothetical protein